MELQSTKSKKKTETSARLSLPACLPAFKSIEQTNIGFFFVVFIIRWGIFFFPLRPRPRKRERKLKIKEEKIIYRDIKTTKLKKKLLID